MFGRIRSEVKCLQQKGQNSSVREDKIRMPMFTMIGAEFQC